MRDYTEPPGFLRLKESSHKLELSGGGFQPGYFLRSETSESSGMNIEFQRSVANSLNLLDVVSDLLKHAPDLAISAFSECNFVPWIIGFLN